VNLYPAIDILGGSAVRLVKGDFDAKKVYDEDPLSAARGWIEAGARRLHVVDLDGARSGEPVNLEHLRQISRLDVPVQYGGGLRSAGAVKDALAAGAARVIIGTAAFTDLSLLGELLDCHEPEQVLVAVDVREGYVATHGWLQSTGARARDAFADLRTRGVRHFVFTNIDHDGMLDGPNREEVAWVAKAAGDEGTSGDGTVIYSGGIGALSDLEALSSLRAELELDRLTGVIVGKALYEGCFTIDEAHAALGDTGAALAG
jgi:phosphoribosylformimino-5-aminoimidazole carboxamide ribotide isomerase